MESDSHHSPPAPCDLGASCSACILGLGKGLRPHQHSVALRGRRPGAHSCWPLRKGPARKPDALMHAAWVPGRPWIWKCEALGSPHIPSHPVQPQASSLRRWLSWGAFPSTPLTVKLDKRFCVKSVSKTQGSIFWVEQNDPVWSLRWSAASRNGALHAAAHTAGTPG